LDFGLMLVQPTARPMGGQSGGQGYDDPMMQSRGGGVSGIPFPEPTLHFADDRQDCLRFSWCHIR